MISFDLNNKIQNKWVLSGTEQYIQQKIHPTWVMESAEYFNIFSWCSGLPHPAAKQLLSTPLTWWNVERTWRTRASKPIDQDEGYLIGEGKKRKWWKNNQLSSPKAAWYSATLWATLEAETPPILTVPTAFIGKNTDVWYGMANPFGMFSSVLPSVLPQPSYWGT